MGKVNSVLLIFCLLIVIVGCSSTPAPQKDTASAAPVKKESIFYTGKPCFTRMVDQARRWSLDAMPIHVESELNSESDGHDGKSTIWTGTFLSASRGKTRIFTCSGSVLPDSPAMGVSGSLEITSSTAAPMFDPSFLGIDSNEAFLVAQEKGGAKLLEKNPKQTVVYVLDWDAKNRQLLWGVIYGTDMKNSKGIGVIDARTGKFLHAHK